MKYSECGKWTGPALREGRAVKARTRLDNNEQEVSLLKERPYSVVVTGSELGSR